MAASQISNRARIYSLYTGAPRQLAVDVVTALPAGAPLIAAPVHPAQRLFESEVFYQLLASQRQIHEHPFGIPYVEPTPNGLRLHLDGTESMASLLSGLLPQRVPFRSERDQIYGINGLRIVARTRHGIELRRLGQPTSLRLTGCSASAFAAAEATLVQQTQDSGNEACWRSDALTDCEQQWDADRQPLIYEPIWRDAAWLPSGLLRRLGLLHTVAVPHVVTGHEARLGGWWILELDHDSDTGLRRAELAQALTDPVHGLPLKLSGHRDLVPGNRLGLVLLKAPNGTATLQLRYDRFDYAVQGRFETFAAIRQRIAKVTNEARLPSMPGCRADR